MSAGNASAAVDPAQCKRMREWPPTLSCRTPGSLEAGRGPLRPRRSPAALRQARWSVVGGRRRTGCRPSRDACGGRSASADGRAVTAGIRPPPRLTFPLDSSEHIFGSKQFLWAARSEVGSHLLCRRYTWINTFLGLLNPSPLCVCFPADTPLASEASIFPESQQR